MPRRKSTIMAGGLTLRPVNDIEPIPDRDNKGETREERIRNIFTFANPLDQGTEDHPFLSSDLPRCFILGVEGVYVLTSSSP
jgi:hypothetical protein